MREPGLIEANVSMGVDRLTDRDRPMELEKTHTPVIEAPERVRKGEPFACTIRLGAIPHDDKGSEHYVELVELFADRQYLTRIEFTPRSACRRIATSANCGPTSGATFTEPGSAPEASPWWIDRSG